MTDLIANFSAMQLLTYGLGGLIALFLGCLLIRKQFKKHTQTHKGERLGISEYCEIDENRRLVLVRRDNVEHLVMIGGTQDFVIETGIQIDTKAQDESSALPSKTSKNSTPIPMRPPRAPVFGAKQPVTISSAAETPVKA